MGEVPDSRHVILLVAIIATQNVVCASRVAFVMLFILKTCL